MFILHRVKYSLETPPDPFWTTTPVSCQAHLPCQSTHVYFLPSNLIFDETPILARNVLGRGSGRIVVLNQGVTRVARGSHWGGNSTGHPRRLFNRYNGLRIHAMSSVYSMTHMHRSCRELSSVHGHIAHARAWHARCLYSVARTPHDTDGCCRPATVLQ